MDLTLLIVVVIAGFLIFSLIGTVRSLTEEIKEIKNKCIGENKGAKFTKTTQDPVESFNINLIDNIKYFQTFFDRQL